MTDISIAEQFPGSCSPQVVNLDATPSVDVVALHRRVLRSNDRIELTCRDGGTTVLISKAELDALEEALEILSDTNEVRALRLEVQRVAVNDRRSALRPRK